MSWLIRAVTRALNVAGPEKMYSVTYALPQRALRHCFWMIASKLALDCGDGCLTEREIQ